MRRHVPNSRPSGDVSIYGHQQSRNGADATEVAAGASRRTPASKLQSRIAESGTVCCPPTRVIIVHSDEPETPRRTVPPRLTLNGNRRALPRRNISGLEARCRTFGEAGCASPDATGRTGHGLSREFSSTGHENARGEVACAARREIPNLSDLPYRRLGQAILLTADVHVAHGVVYV